MRNAVKMVKLIAIFTALANLFGCTAKKLHMLDGPGMVYVDSEHRTEYANTLPFDELEGYPYCAVVFLGKGEIGEANRKKYIDKFIKNLPPKSILIKFSGLQYDYPADIQNIDDIPKILDFGMFNDLFFIIK